MAKEYHYTWTWDLESSPEALWPLVSDTNRFNRDTGLPPMELLSISNGIKLVRFKIPLVQVEWEEEPFEWTYPYRFGILRRYRKGPLAEMRVDCRLERLQPSGTRMVYDVLVKAKNILGDVSIPLAIGIVSARQFETVFKRYDRIASNGGPELVFPKGRALSSNGRSRLQVMRDRLKDQGVDESILNPLYEFLQHADDLSIQRMRPYALADGWGVSRRAVLEAFLYATRVGVLDLYWDLLCPECRGVAEDYARLNDVHASSHCNTCQIDFRVNFDHNVEVIFRPNQSVRAVDATVEFCVGSPQRQPHIAFSLIVPPHEELPFSTMLSEGRYSLRSSHVSGAQILLATQDGVERIDFFANYKGWPTGVTELGLMPTIRLVNETDQPLTVELMRTAWSDQAATAADVTTLQVFRDLFSSEVLRPGEEISVGATTLMFTDLRNSTRMYREIGDAPAFGRVREHFEILEQAVAAEGGSIVKTMGDAIMAAFRSPVSAVRAIWTVQKQIAERGTPPLSLKVGIHHGPCIVVNLNDRLDYFGSTVNITARLPNFSVGGEAILSDAIRNDEDVIEFLEKNAPPNSLTRFQGEIRGYDQSMDLWRIKMQ
ncbi:MAG: adenylate/guanylate cyclase domain-containing protein [Anaerolineales bacterium]|uniref:adenylate/guanylate cyclase domain-containing protein n=1 Tax=Candidatus Villigracilis proximus TaxID=3140683 RepID=UPI003136EAE6|nr:adenylate/guanylate cyclase domain-containing protein [Anaerolineales bacterium]